jgi:hypothetical protein
MGRRSSGAPPFAFLSVIPVGDLLFLRTPTTLSSRPKRRDLLLGCECRRNLKNGQERSRSARYPTHCTPANKLAGDPAFHEKQKRERMGHPR